MLAQVWHWWLSVFLAVGAIGIFVAIAAGYYVKVQRPKHPRRPRK